MIETGKPVPEVAGERGVHPGMLHSWVSRWPRNGSASPDRPTEPAQGRRLHESERAELERLRREMSEKGSGGTYGSPKIGLLLVRAGRRVSVNTVARLMAELGLAGRKIHRRRGLTRPQAARLRTSSAVTSPPMLRTRCGAAT
ncbi:IS3 family transposase [Streptomyces sp. NPDC059153]|uniref:IS3 family transposase n=1 Tax=Streptomyces sp. NPDC059153 TaxID=3346743 RepID=UPI0036881124